MSKYPGWCPHCKFSLGYKQVSEDGKCPWCKAEVPPLPEPPAEPENSKDDHTPDCD